jgi:hypothetical protein
MTTKGKSQRQTKRERQIKSGSEGQRRKANQAKGQIVLREG